ncbi:MAG TPA: hypothetical protein PLY79_10450, partial [Ferruginibacter sp.]|nr:hypothetical protein [Ferruginibacter sp.]
IDFALAVLKTLATYPFPFSLIPVAGLTVAYALQRSQIQRQKFEQGGMPKEGGPIRGKSHAYGGVPFNYEAEDGELAIINKRSAMLNRRFTVTGTPRQIASAINQIGGGTRFAPGAAIRKLEYGGLLGSNLRPPSDLSFLRTATPYNGDDGLIKSVGEKLNQVTDTVYQLARQTNERIDKIKVEVVSQEVSEKDKEIKAAEAIGRLK